MLGCLSGILNWTHLGSSGKWFNKLKTENASSSRLLVVISISWCSSVTFKEAVCVFWGRTVFASRSRNWDSRYH
jgi:hypothetical protein